MRIEQHSESNIRKPYRTREKSNGIWTTLFVLGIAVVVIGVLAI